MRGSACSDLLRGAYSSLDALKATCFLRDVAVLRSHSASIQARAARAKYVRVSSDSSRSQVQLSASLGCACTTSTISRSIERAEAQPEKLPKVPEHRLASCQSDHAPQPGEGPALPTAGCLSRGSHRALSLSSPRRSQSRGSQDLRLPFIVSAELRYRRRHGFHSC